MSKSSKVEKQEYSLGEPRLKRRIVFTFVLILTAPTMLLLIFGLPLDNYDKQWVSCDVVSAKAERARARTGPPWHVRIETENCKSMILIRGVDEGNAQEIAASIEPGKAYEFQLGWLSRVSIDHPIIFLDPTVRDFREVPK